MTNILFICGKARMRSPTAADLCSDWPNISADFGGLSNDADERVSLEQIEWADKIYVMEKRQRTKLIHIFGPELKATRVICLNVPDRYTYGQPELIAALEAKLKPILNPNQMRQS